MKVRRKYASAFAISSATASFVSRSIAVSHSLSTSACSARSRAAVAGSITSRAISRSHSRMLWRCTSVGCAVSTGLTRARPNHSSSSAAVLPSAARSSA